MTKDIVQLITAYKENHEKMWLWAAKNPRASRLDYPAAQQNNITCYACMFAREVQKALNSTQAGCSLCLLEWDSGTCIDGDIYRLYLQSTDESERKELALKIAYLPLKEIWQFVLDEPVEEYGEEIQEHYFHNETQELNFDGGRHRRQYGF